MRFEPSRWTHAICHQGEGGGRGLGRCPPDRRQRFPDLVCGPPGAARRRGSTTPCEIQRVGPDRTERWARADEGLGLPPRMQLWVAATSTQARSSRASKFDLNPCWGSESSAGVNSGGSELTWPISTMSARDPRHQRRHQNRSRIPIQLPLSSAHLRADAAVLCVLCR